MRKLIFFLAIVSFVLFACNPLKPKSGAPAPIFNAQDSIPRSTAMAMILHYEDPIVNKTNVEFRRLVLNDADLYRIFKIKDITRAGFVMAAYLANDSIQTRQNKVAVLLQLKRGYNSSYYYYDATGYLCPPPMGCGAEN